MPRSFFQSRSLFQLPSLLILMVLLPFVGCKDHSLGEGSHISIQLVADQESVAPGSTFTLGVKFMPDPGWHLYWKNPGDSGLPPRFEWHTPTGVTIKPNLWPYPERITIGPLVNYGYGEVLLPFPATLSASALAHGALPFEVHVKWLVCKDECLPGEATLTLSIPISERAGEPSRYTGIFSDTYAAVPAPLSRVSIAVEEQQDQLVVALIPLEPRFFPQSMTFFPEDPRIIVNAATQTIKREGAALTIALKRDPNRRGPVERIRGVIYSPQGWSQKGTPKAVSIDTRAEELPNGTSKPLITVPYKNAPTETTGFWSALLLALLGGMLLNLMPCVFPVLSIKILGFIEHAKDDAKTIRLHGISFCLGVLVSFWVLAGLLLSLRAGGEQLGWGFQLQSPTFIVAMIFVFLGLALTFLSDIVLGHYIQSLAGGTRLSNSATGAFFNGVLATAVATPCTGPFMGSALAATLTLPPVLSLLVFTSLGLGMSLPYLALSFNPKLLKFLPRPGAWMELFKEFMAFPLFATVLWLVRVFARQMGMDPYGLGVLMDVLWGTLLAGFGFWLFIGASALRSKIIRRTLTAVTLLCFALGVMIAVPTRAEIDASRVRACDINGESTPQPDRHGLIWEPYSERRVSELVASGRPVYLDFTAEWCITCQVNEARVFGSEEVRALIRKKNVALIKGDWTSSNPVITEALRGFGRNGVPLNVILLGDQKPIILPNLLTPGAVLEALGAL